MKNNEKYDIAKETRKNLRLLVVARPDLVSYSKLLRGKFASVSLFTTARDLGVSLEDATEMLTECLSEALRLPIYREQVVVVDAFDVSLTQLALTFARETDKFDVRYRGVVDFPLSNEVAAGGANDPHGELLKSDLTDLGLVTKWTNHIAKNNEQLFQKFEEDGRGVNATVFSEQYPNFVTQ